MRRFRSLLFLLVALAARVPAEDAPVPVGVLELTSENVSPAELHLLTDRLRHELVQTNRYAVVEREKMDAILREQGFQQSGCVATECVVEVGQLLGARMMVAGSLGTVGDVYTMTIRLVDVRDGRVLRTAVRDCRCGLPDVLMTVVGQVAADMAEVEASRAPQSQLIRRETPNLQGSIFSTTWTKDGSPYRIIGPITVMAGNTLQIESGVDVLFDNPVAFTVAGTLVATGNEADSIRFIGGRSPFWAGIRVEGEGNINAEYIRITSTGSGSPAIQSESRGAIQIARSGITRNGGGVDIAGGGIATFESCNIARNSGGINISNGSQVTFTRSIIDHNGQGMSLKPRFKQNTTIAMRFCTYSFNGPSADGPAISNEGAVFEISNSIIFRNRTTIGRYYTTQLMIGSRDGRVVSSRNVVQSRLEGFRNGVADPLFVDPEHDDFHLRPGSPCIDAGDPNSPLDPDGTRADIGAFYFDQRAQPVSGR